MADEADIAAEHLEREMALMLRRPLRWCDAECRDDWERDRARRS